MHLQYIQWYTGGCILFQEGTQKVFMKQLQHFGSDYSELHKVGRLYV